MNARVHCGLTNGLWTLTDSKSMSTLLCFSLFQVGCMGLGIEVVKNLFRVLVLLIEY